MTLSENQLFERSIEFASSIFITAAALVSSVSFGAEPAASSTTYRVYFGTYTGQKSKGIYVAEFDSSSGALSVPELAAETQNPTFLAVDPEANNLYAVNEVAGFGDGKSGGVSCFHLDQSTGKLAFVNEERSGGAGPCHLAVDPKSRCVLVANYGSGSVAVLPIEPGGRLRPPCTSIQHHGSSVNPHRQEGPHAHFITWDPANRFVLTCDLGLDKVLFYRLTPDLSLMPDDPPAFASRPGSGPRHVAFHPNGRFAFIINEMASTVTACEYQSEKGEFKEIQTISTLPEQFKGENTCAEITVHPSGRWVYGSNRGADNIAVFECDSISGRLRTVQHQGTNGKTPRHFTLDPTSKWLLAENQDSNNVVVFRVDPETGRLAATGRAIELGSPVCAVFVKKR
ncbi:MAG TPA: lactonase family protein [Verrucomicrobiae bacterium]|nr:lactonase family protein [Verrucomicrobiae bacterium]